MTDAPSVQVIAYRAPSEAFRRRIEEHVESPVGYFIAGKLRNQGVVQALREVRRLSGREAIVAIENEDSRVLAGPLALIAAIGGFRKIGVVWPDGAYQLFNRRDLATLLGGIVADQISSRLRFAAAKRAAGRFARTKSLVLKKAADAKTILYLDANLSFGVAAGGSVGHIKGVIDAFVGRGFAVDYLSARAMATDRHGANWLKVPPPSLYSFPAELIYYAFAPIFERSAQQSAAARKYGFLYQRMSLHNFSGARLRQSLGLPLVLEYNGSEAWAAANWGDRLVLHDMAISTESAALRNADLVVTVSKVLAEEVVAAGVPQERVLVYPNCIDPEIFDPGRYSAEQTAALRKRLGIAEGALVASFIGTFGTWHGVDFLGEAIRQIVDTDRDWLVRNRLHFLVIGDGLKMPEIKRSVGDEPYRQFVTLAGLIPQKDAPAYLAASDIFLSPHLPNPDGTPFFGSPTKLFEYMAMQRPIIASDLDQIGKVLKGDYMPGKDAAAPPYAELFEPGNRQAFIAALRRVVDDKAAATAMASRSRQAALSHYTWDHHVGAILDRLRELGIAK